MSQPATATAESVSPEVPGVTEADFADLVRSNQSMVFSIAYNFLHDQGLAEELAQDVFLQLFRNLGRMESPGHVTHWLRRVTGHRCIDAARKRGGVREVDLESAPEPSSDGSQPDPLIRDRLHKLIASLPEDKRLLIVLRYQEEMEFEEIGKTLDMPARTVRTQLWRTLKLLREKADRLLGESAVKNGEVPS